MTPIKRIVFSHAKISCHHYYVTPSDIV